MIKAVVLGDFYTVLSVRAERLPRPYQTVDGDSFTTLGGGRGTLQAVTAARLGAQVTFIGRIGEDLNAQIATQLFEQENIDTDAIVRDKSAATGVQLTFTDPDNRPMSALVPGANHRLTASDVERVKRVLMGADVLITQLGVPQDAVRRALELARENNVQSVLKPSPFAPVPPDLLALADVVTPNEEELRELATNVSRKDKPAGQITVCTLGAKGAQWFRQDGVMKTGRVVGFPARVVDVSGAGDVFSAALGVALAEKQPLEPAIRFANAAAARAVMVRGTIASAPTRDMVEQRL